MAIYHCSVKTVSRAKGGSAVASAAYRSGEKLIDHTTGEVKDYTRKGGVLGTGLVFPKNFDHILIRDREQLWNMAEQSEKRKNSTVAREIEVALPAELNLEGQKILVKNFCKKLANSHGVAVDYAIHAPSRAGDERNYHAHILMTTRRLNADGELGEKTREWDDKKQGSTTVQYWRMEWADSCNVSLQVAGCGERIDYRSLRAQGIDREPTTHKGVARTAMERKGIEFPIEQTAEPVFEPRFKEQVEIKKAEEQIVDLNEKITQIQQLKKEEMQRIEQERYDAERAEKYAQHRLEEKIDSQYEYDRIGAMFDPEMEEKWLRLVADGKVSRDKQTIEAAEYAIAERNGKRVDINNPFAIIKKLEYLHYTNIYLRCEKNELNQNIEAFDPKKLKAEMKKKADEHFELKKQYEKEASIFKIGIESVKLVATLGVNWKNTKAKLDRWENIDNKINQTSREYHQLKGKMSDYKENCENAKKRLAKIDAYQVAITREKEALTKMTNQPSVLNRLQAHFENMSKNGQLDCSSFNYLHRLKNELGIRIDMEKIYQQEPKIETPTISRSRSHDKGHGMSR